jgi:hypothetical protein
VRLRWRTRRRAEIEAAARDDDAEDAAAARDRVLGLAKMAPAQPLVADRQPPNAPSWDPVRWPTNRPADSRLTDPPDNRRRW